MLVAVLLPWIQDIKYGAVLVAAFYYFLVFSDKNGMSFTTWKWKIHLNCSSRNKSSISFEAVTIVRVSRPFYTIFFFHASLLKTSYFPQAIRAFACVDSKVVENPITLTRVVNLVRCTCGDPYYAKWCGTKFPWVRVFRSVCGTPLHPRTPSFSPPMFVNYLGPNGTKT